MDYPECWVLSLDGVEHGQLVKLRPFWALDREIWPRGIAVEYIWGESLQR